MKTNDQTSSWYLAGASLALMGLLGVSPANAATVTLTTTDTIGTTSMDQDGVNNWSDATDPSAGNDYFVDVEWLRTPGSGDLVFAGDSLTVQSNGGIINKNGGAQTLTVDLILDGGLVRSGSGAPDIFTLAGTLDVTANNGALVPDQSPYIINSDITGAGTLYLLNDASLYGFSSASGPGQGIDLAGSGTMTGNVVADASDMVWMDTSSWLFNIGAAGTNNAITGTGDATFNGAFNFDLTGASSTPGDSWTIIDVTSTTFGSTFSVSTTGFSQSGSVWTDGTYTFNPLSGILAVAEPPLEWFVDTDGTWSTNSNWSTGVAPATDGDALLGAVITENRTVTLDTNVQLNSLTFSNAGDGDYFVVPSTNETLTLTGEGKIDVAGRHWVKAEVAGTIGMNVMGNGELVLDADNSFSGGLSVDGTNVGILHTDAIPTGNDIAITNGGAVRFWGTENAFFADNGTTGYGTGTVDGNVSIDATSSIHVNDGADVTFTGVISGDGSVNVGGGTVSLSTAHTYAGNTTIAEGTLELSGAGTLGSTAGQTTVNGDQATGKLALSGGVAVGSELLVLGARQGASIDAIHLTSDGSNSWAGNIRGDLGGTQYNIESTSGTLTLSGIVSAPTTAIRNFVFSGDGNINLTGSLVDVDVLADGTPETGPIITEKNVNLIKRGTGTMTIATGTTDGNDYWRGTTTVEEGTLAVQTSGSNAGELFSSSIDVRAGATFDTSSFATYSLQVTDDPDGIAFNGDEVGQTVSGAGTINTGAGTMVAFEDAVFSPGDSGVGTLNVTGNLSINRSQANPNGALNWDLGGSAAGPNDQIAVSGNLDLDADGVAGGGQFKLDVTLTGASLDTSAYALMTAGSTSGSTATNADFDVTIFNEAGTQLDTRQDDTVTVSVNATDVTIQFAAAQSMNWTGAADGTTWDVGTTGNWSSTDNLFFDLDSVSFSGTNTVNVAAAVTPGGMNIASGSTTFTGAEIQGAGNVAVAAGASATFNNDGVNSVNNVSLGAGATLEENQATGETQLNGNLSGTGALTVTAGQVVLSGDNSAFTGSMNVNGGTLNLNAANGLGNASVSVNAGGTLLSNDDSYTVTKDFTLNGGQLLVSGNNADATFQNTITLTANSSITSNDNTTFGTTINNVVVGANTLTVQNNFNSNVDVAGTISGSGTMATSGNTGSTTMLDGSALTVSNISVGNEFLDVTAMNAGAGLALASGQTMAVNDGSTVRGVVTAASGSTVRVGSAGMTVIVSNSGLLDDFDGYSTGDTTTATGGVWNAETTVVANSSIVTSDQGQSLETVGGTAWSGAERSITGTDAAVLVGETQTYFWQVKADYTSDPTGWDYDFMMGLSPDVSNIDTTDAWSDFSVMPFINNEATTPYINADAPTTPWWALMNPGEWTNVWVVIDNDAADPTFDLYYATAADPNTPVLVASDANWRNFSAGQDLNAIGFMAAGNAGNTLLIDNIWYSAGVETTNPLVNPWGSSSSTYLPETATVDGDLVLSTGSTLELDIFDPTTMDLLNVTGNLTAAGTLEVTLEGTAPALAEGDAFDILDFGTATGAFDTLTLPALGSGLSWDTSNLLTTGVLEVIASLLTGDLDADGFVGITDLNVILSQWNDTVTPGDLLSGDPSGDGFVGIEDLNVVLANWNNGTPPSTNAAIPEPTTLAILGMGGFAMMRRHRKLA